MCLQAELVSQQRQTVAGRRRAAGPVLAERRKRSEPRRSSSTLLHPGLLFTVGLSSALCLSAGQQPFQAAPHPQTAAPPASVAVQE